MFDYLCDEQLPDTPEPVVVFGRNDQRVAEAAGELVAANLAEVIVISGGVGKDTGDLLEKGYDSEASFIEAMLIADTKSRDVDLPPYYLDKKAANGGDNARNSLDILREHSYPGVSLTAVAHATSLRRLAATLEHEAGIKLGQHPVVNRKASSYGFDSTKPHDQAEAAAEILRLHRWPQKGMLGPQPDLPQNLVDFAEDKHG